ncbi:fungal-specific transcription factor domain-containing protein [Lipomyces orientalis]|uniref:Fungal-specific transcription factor domain-containing protein n=1 Tax=Lipomyces orientalis TaxID=1233043 RepID=A0ACC3TJF0_9ASCO
MTASTKKGLRSSIACKRCNAAKSRCDVAQHGSPCTRCQLRNYPDCQPIQSRRGTYNRKESNQTASALVAESTPLTSQNTTAADIIGKQRRRTPLTSSASAPAASLPNTDKELQPTTAETTTATEAATTAPVGLSSANSVGSVLPRTRIVNPDGTQPELQAAGLSPLLDLSARILSPRLQLLPGGIRSLEPEHGEHPHSGSMSSPDSDTSSPSSGPLAGNGPMGSQPQPRSLPFPSSSGRKQSKEWARVFKGLFDNVAVTSVTSTNSFRSRKRPLLYFGESFPVSWLLQKVQKEQPGQICIARPRLTEIYGDSGECDPSVEEPPRIMLQGAEHPAHMTPAKIIYLTSESCFTKPSKEAVEQLFTMYFQKVHNVYPIINRPDFARLYEQDKVPWLLFHSICFAAASHCPIGILCREGGHSASREARMEFYRRAKSLFDLSYEKNKIVLIQSAMLLSFWGGEPDDYWNTVSWISMAVNIAESLGMHRAVSSADLGDEDRSLWRRIWWCLVSRDSFCAALLGKPQRINVSQCDVEPLSLDDFLDDADAAPVSLWGHRRKEYGLYVIENAKLSQILRSIVQARDGHRIDTDFVLAMHRALQDWEENMPDKLRVHTLSPDSPIFVYGAALSLIYNHHLVYLHQTAPPDCSISLEVAHEAVSNIAEFGSTLATISVIPFMPHDTLASFFVAIVMLFTQMQQKSNISPDRLRLFRMQLKICEMIVHQAQDHWDHADWILAISDGLRHRFMEAGDSNGGGRNSCDGSSPSAASCSSGESVVDAPSANSTFQNNYSGNAIGNNLPHFGYNEGLAYDMQNIIRHGVGNSWSMMGLGNSSVAGNNNYGSSNNNNRSCPSDEDQQMVDLDELVDCLDPQNSLTVAAATAAVAKGYGSANGYGHNGDGRAVAAKPSPTPSTNSAIDFGTLFTVLG